MGTSEEGGVEFFVRNAFVAGRRSERQRRNRADRAEFVAERPVERSLTRD